MLGAFRTNALRGGEGGEGEVHGVGTRGEGDHAEGRLFRSFRFRRHIPPPVEASP